MPTPARGTVVLQAGTVTAVSAPTCTVTVGGLSYTLPYVTAPTPTDEVWVLWVGRTGLVLGTVAA